MKGINRVELSNINEIDSLKLIPSNRNWLIHVSKANRIGRINLIVAIKVCVEAIHNHDHFINPFVFGIIGVAAAGHGRIFRQDGDWGQGQ